MGYLCDEIDSAFSLVGDPEVASVETWDMFIDSGSYNVGTQVQMKVPLSLSQNSTFVLRGSGMKETIISDTFVSALIYSDDSRADFHISMNNLTYLPMFGVHQDFLSLTYTKQLELDNIIIDAKNSDGYSGDIIYSYATDLIYVNNLDVYDIDGGSSTATIFDLTYCDTIVIKNVFVSTNILGDDSTVQFSYVDGTEVDIYFDNITISNVYGQNLFLFYDNYYDLVIDVYSIFTRIYLNNIVLDNVYGGSMFYFDSNDYCNISMTNIYVNGNHKYLHSQLVDFRDNYYSTLTVGNAIFCNFILNSSSLILLYFNLPIASDYVYFRNVSFTNLTSAGGAYSLIYVYHSFNIIINESEFHNIENFSALIHCRSSSFCTLTVTNSIFHNNIGSDGCNENIFYLEDAAHATVNIYGNTFYGYPSLYYDSTTNLTISNNTILNSTAATDCSTTNVSDLSTTRSDVPNCSNVSSPCVTSSQVTSLIASTSGSTESPHDTTTSMFIYGTKRPLTVANTTIVFHTETTARSKTDIVNSNEYYFFGIDLLTIGIVCIVILLIC